jgi:hypothetical protein
MVNSNTNPNADSDSNPNPNPNPDCLGPDANWEVWTIQKVDGEVRDSVRIRVRLRAGFGLELGRKMAWVWGGIREV